MEPDYQVLYTELKAAAFRYFEVRVAAKALSDDLKAAVDQSAKDIVLESIALNKVELATSRDALNLLSQ